MIIGKVTWCVKSSVVKKYIQLKTLLLLSDSFLDWEDRIFVKLYLNLYMIKFRCYASIHL